MTLRDRFVRGLGRAVLRVFFRRVEIVGSENVPADGPLIFVGNHPNALVDPFVAVAFLPRTPRFLAKSTLWNNPAVRPLLALAGSIPVYRAQDGGDMSQNDTTFERCHDALAEGRAIALFPEGISHDEPSMQPLKTGAARIALGAEQARGPLGLQMVPLGLTFEDKALFRSRVLIQIGEPIDLEPYLVQSRTDERAAARALTDAIGEALAGVTLNFDSWEDARLVSRAVEIHARRSSPSDGSDPSSGSAGSGRSDGQGDGEPDMPGRPQLAEHFSLRQRFGAAYERLREEEPERMKELRERVESYSERLDRLGVRDDQLSARYPRDSVVRYLRRRVPLLPLWLPASVVGTLLNWLPYRAAGLMANTVKDTPDQPASFKLLTGFFLFPIVWVLEACLVGSVLGLGAGLWTVLIAPASGWAALLFHERTESLEQEVRAYLALRTHADEAAALRRQRLEIEREIGELVPHA